MNLHRQIGAFDPRFGYHFVPGLKARVEHRGGGYRVRTNEAGFRSDHEFARDKPEGCFRVLVFGDSFTAGDGVSNGERFSGVVETLIPDCQVYNFGLPGTGPDEHYLVYRNVAAEIEHDLVIIAVWVENIRRIMAHYRPGLVSTTGELAWSPKAYFTLSSTGSLVRHNDPVPRRRLATEELDGADRQMMVSQTGLRATRHIPQFVRAAVQRTTRYEFLPDYHDSQTPGWRLMRTILATWIEELRVPALIMPLPLGRHVEETADASHYQRRFAELSSPPDVIIHDPLPTILSYSAEERRSFRFAPDDDHPTKAYHRVLGGSLAAPVTRAKELRDQARVDEHP